MESLETNRISSLEKFTQDVNNNVILLSLASLAIVMYLFQILAQKWKKKPNKKVIEFEDLHGPLRIPIVGPIWILFPIQKVLYRALDVSKKFGACFRANLFNEKIVVLNSPEGVQSFLKTGDLGHVVKAPLIYDLMKPFIVNGVLVSKGTFWKSERKILSRFMFMSNVKEHLPMLEKHVRRFVTTLESLSKHQQAHPISDAVNISFLEIITELLTGADVHGNQTGFEYHHNFEMWQATASYRVLNPWLLSNLLWKFHPLQQKQMSAINGMTEFSQQRLKECKEKRLKDVKNGPKQTMLDALLDADVPDEQIIDELNTMMFGGHDTTASTIQFFLLLIALNPHHQELCRNEVDLMFDSTNTLSFETLSEINHLERCILESLRMFPVVFAFGRKLESPLTIDYNNKTLSLEPGVNILISPWLIHRNPENFSNPNVFDPDRFLPEERAKRHSHAFIPFSSGQRNCLGIKFAMMQLKLVAAHVLHKFEVTTTEKMEDIVLLPIVTLVPQKQFRFIFKNRR